jgi:hypothetical protein
MEIHLKIIGFILILLALLHSGFPKYFKWRENLLPLSLINRQMMQTHTFFIALMVFLMGLLCFTNSYDLIYTSLGNNICLGFGVFWITRLYFQLFVYARELWRRKVFETFIHIVFTFFWFYLSFIFLSIYFNTQINY